MDKKNRILSLDLAGYSESNYRTIREFGDSFYKDFSDVSFRYLDQSAKSVQESDSQFVQFLLKSKNLQNWQRQDDGLLKAFAAATQSEPATAGAGKPATQLGACPEPVVCPKLPDPVLCPKPPEPVLCPKPPEPVLCPKPPEPVVCPNYTGSNTNDSSDSQQSKWFGFGLGAGALGTALLLKIRSSDRKKQEEKLPPIPNTHNLRQVSGRSSSPK